MAIFEHVSQTLFAYKYLALFPVAVVEGPIVSVLSGMWIKLGVFSFWPAYLTLIAADLVGDVMWYCVGKFGFVKVVNRWGHMFHLHPERMQKIEKKFLQHQSKTLIISKLTMGLGFPFVTLVTAGMIGIPFKKFLALNFFGQIIWSVVLIALGYFFGNLYTVLDESFRLIATCAFVLLVFFALHGFQKYLRNRAKD